MKNDNKTIPVGLALLENDSLYNNPALGDDGLFLGDQTVIHMLDLTQSSIPKGDITSSMWGLFSHMALCFAPSGCAELCKILALLQGTRMNVNEISMFVRQIFLPKEAVTNWSLATNRGVPLGDIDPASKYYNEDNKSHFWRLYDCLRLPPPKYLK